MESIKYFITIMAQLAALFIGISAIAAIIGIPLYVRVETAIPIGLALMQKGVSIGAVIALIIGGEGMAIPEMSMLASIFKKKLVAAIVGVVFTTAVISGYIFNMI